MVIHMKSDKTKNPTFYILTIGGECFFILVLLALCLFSTADYGSRNYLFGEFIMNFAQREIVFTFLSGFVSYILNLQ